MEEVVLQRARSETKSYVVAKEFVAAFIGVLWVALCSYVQVPLGFTPVPFTMQTFGVLTLGMVAGWKRGLLSSALYVVLASLGLPILAGGASRFGCLFGCTGGYILGFILETGLAGMANRFSPLYRLSLLISASFLQLFMGTLWLGTYVGFSSAFALGLWPFLPMELVKIGLAFQFVKMCKHLS